MEYFITLEKEVMSEVAASIIATISRYMISKGMQNDDKHPLNIIENMLYTLKDSLIGKEYTIEELKRIQAKLEFSRDYVNEVIKNNE
ncbi:MAG: hypothetical protein IKK91_01355 [Ruminococcus sp.]|nr:hypothetical protein [Ruminococcus sp.]MBR6622535.1 hypothetical protein [Ruminococcus sp.]